MFQLLQMLTQAGTSKSLLSQVPFEHQQVNVSSFSRSPNFHCSYTIIQLLWVLTFQSTLQLRSFAYTLELALISFRAYTSINGNLQLNWSPALWRTCQLFSKLTVQLILSCLRLNWHLNSFQHFFFSTHFICHFNVFQYLYFNCHFNYIFNRGSILAITNVSTANVFCSYNYKTFITLKFCNQLLFFFRLIHQKNHYQATNWTKIW